MNTSRLQGRYRTEAAGSRPAMAYVVDGRLASFVSEAVYRAKRYEPEFDTLLTEEQYDS